MRVVIFDPQSEHLRFPCAGGQFVTVQHIENGADSIGAFGAMLSIYSLPREQEAQKLGDRYRLNLGPQTIDRQPMDSRQQSTIAPLQFLRTRMKLAAQYESFALESKERHVNFGLRHLEKFSERGGCQRAADFHAASDQFAKSVGALPVLFEFSRRRSQRRLDYGIGINRANDGQPLGGERENVR